MACHHSLMARLRHERMMVGATRFELVTFCTPSRRATRLRYTPMSVQEKDKDWKVSTYPKRVKTMEAESGRL
jgi:hypothetical protein